MLKPKQSKTHDSSLIDWLRLARTNNIGPVTFKRLMAKFGNVTDVIEVLPELSKAGGKKFVSLSKQAAEKELEIVSNNGGQILTWLDERFPNQLKETDGAPVVLTAYGDVDLLSKRQVGIVGSRNGSLNGRKYATKLAAGLGKNDFVITSGMARGIDTAAHEGAIDSGTIAVMAGGIDQVYPKENMKLYHQIIEKGLVVTESPFGQAPSAHLFPRRNRIVSGLSEGVIVVEASLRSGSLITARLAGEQGRDVMAVPGHPNDPRAAGPNKLIREGAVLITSIDDVLDQLNTFQKKNSMMLLEEGDVFEPYENTDFSDIEKAREEILSHLSVEPVPIDEVVRACHLSVSLVQTTLLALELAGKVQKLPGNKVSRIE